jgi:hypothetical protein
MDETTDKDGLPQLPISASARAFCEMTAPANKGDIKVRAHYRRRFKRLPKKKSNPEPTTKIEKEDHRFAISLHIQEMRDLLSASCKTDNSPSF